MKKIYLILTVVIACSFQTLQAQVWSPLDMGPGIAGGSTSTTAIGTYNGNIVAGGAYGGVVSVWNGATWTAIGQPIDYNFQGVDILVQFENNLYVAGYFDSITGATGVNDLAMWNGAQWSGVKGGGIGVTSTSISCLIVYDSVLYVGGNFDTIGSIAVNNIASWNGSNWSAIPGTGGTVEIAGYPQPTYITRLGIYNNQLVASGLFDTIGGIVAKNIALWNGTTWSNVGSGIPGGAVGITSLGSDLYVVGNYSTADANVDFLAKWNGTTWSYPLVDSSGNQLYCIASYNGNIYVGGYFDSIAGIAANFIAQFDGTSWSGVGGGIDSADQNAAFDNVINMLVFNDHLYISGNFDSCGNVQAPSVAAWGTPLLGIATVPKNITIDFYPNPNTGKFDITLEYISDPPLLEVYNILGQKIYHTTLNTTKTEIDIGIQPAGTYLYRIIDKNGNPISGGKFLVQ